MILACVRKNLITTTIECVNFGTKFVLESVVKCNYHSVPTCPSNVGFRNGVTPFKEMLKGTQMTARGFQANWQRNNFDKWMLRLAGHLLFARHIFPTAVGNYEWSN